MKKTMKRMLCAVLGMLMLFLLASCGGEQKANIDYLVLVNKENKLPDDWEQKLETTTVKNSLGDDVEVEKKAFDAYVKLKKSLAAEGIYVDLDSSRRSVAEQQRIWDDFMEKYGEVYTKRTVATPGYSEHHTGLALDLYLNIDGKDVYENEDMVKYPEIWAAIHEKLAEFGFILRYLEGKEAITGYGYEPWHIRYVDSSEIAGEIAAKGVTLEEYLNKLPKTNVAPPAEEEDPDATVSPIYHQDPIAVIVGKYASTDKKASAIVTSLGMDSVKVTLTVEDDPLHFTEWSMTGEFDSQTLTLAFQDDVMKCFTLDENNVVLSDDVKYIDGSGTVVFNKNALEFTWEDAKSGLGAVTFKPDADSM